MPSLTTFQLPKARVQCIADDAFAQRGVKLDVLRLDELDPHLGGNKWFKLRPHLLQARQQQKNLLASFGGQHSNHLYALACAGQRFGFETAGFVRGFESKSLTPTLRDVRDMGMRLHYLSYSDYKRRNDKGFVASLVKDLLKALSAKQSELYLIPEGGASHIALPAVVDMLPPSLQLSRQQAPAQEALAQNYNTIAVACGTGTTAAGLVWNALAPVAVMGVSVLEDNGSITANISQMLAEAEHLWPRGGDALLPQWLVQSAYSFGGFAKVNAELVHFMDDFSLRHQVPLEPVYTGKLFYALLDLVQQGYFPRGHKVLAVHSGGLQGLRAMQDKMSRLRAS